MWLATLVSLATVGCDYTLSLFLELQAMVKKVLEESSSDTSQATSSTELPTWPAPAPDDTLFRSATSRYFCGQARSDSPFGTIETAPLIVRWCLSWLIDARHQPLISPSEAAVLESMMSGGSHLSLKAHFIDELPFLTPLALTLTSLNLSYNSFTVSLWMPLFLWACRSVSHELAEKPFQELQLRLLFATYNEISTMGCTVKPMKPVYCNHTVDLCASLGQLCTCWVPLGPLYRLHPVYSSQLAGWPLHVCTGLLWPFNFVFCCCVGVSYRNIRI